MNINIFCYFYKTKLQITITMKRTFLLAAICCVMASSCSNESMQLSAQENQKTEAIQNFKKALKNLNSPENLPSDEEKRSPGYPEVNERRLSLLYSAAKGLIQSTGVKENEIQTATNGDKKATVQWALDILRDQNDPSL